MCILAFKEKLGQLISQFYHPPYPNNYTWHSCWNLSGSRGAFRKEVPCFCCSSEICLQDFKSLMWVSSWTWRGREFGLVSKFKRGYTLNTRRIVSSANITKTEKRSHIEQRQHKRSLICLYVSGCKHLQIYKTAITFFQTFLEDISPFYWAPNTPVLDFWWLLPRFQSQGESLICMLCCL